MSETGNVDQSFERYASALFVRDASAAAELYAVPGPILFPGDPVAVSDRAETEAFYASSWPQYECVDTAEPESGSGRTA